MTEISDKVRSLLVVEDEPLIAMMLQDELESLGLHVIGPTSNLKSALLLAERRISTALCWIETSMAHWPT